MNSTLGYSPFICCPGTDRFLCSQSTKLWIIMEYLGGGSALDLVSSGLSNEQLAIGGGGGFVFQCPRTHCLANFLRLPIHSRSALG